MIARARIALEANSVPPEKRHARDLADYETVEVTGEGATWEAEKKSGGAIKFAPPLNNFNPEFYR